jgi:hypothetical protein
VPAPLFCENKDEEKLFKLILNTIRPLLIRLSYIARPYLAYSLKEADY